MPSIQLKVIKPGKMPTAAEYVDAMKKAVMKSAELTRRDLSATVRTWVHQPKFTVVVNEQGGDYSVTAGTDDKIYGYVDEGTRAHEIKPKRSKYLRFGSGFKAKTRVGIIGSQAGGSFGESVFSTGVHHPGTKARGFVIAIQKRRQKTIKQEVDQAIAKMARNQK